jgi:hypothetical protein
MSDGCPKRAGTGALPSPLLASEGTVYGELQTAVFVSNVPKPKICRLYVGLDVRLSVLMPGPRQSSPLQEYWRDPNGVSSEKVVDGPLM